ncbi:MAG: hypothetical protein R2681_14105 [Pyrinomonadaceae bacterium]
MHEGDQKQENTATEEQRDLEIVEGEILAPDETGLNEEETEISPKKRKVLIGPEEKEEKNENTKYYIQYVFLPLIFLLVTLLGGLRVGIENSELIFLRPALICLVFAVIMIALFFRAKLIELESWFSEDQSALKNIANGAVVLTLFSASTQVFNSLLPERGLPFWIVVFCFLWTLWNNLFADFDTRKLLRSLGALFGFAFVAKYLVLSNFVSAEDGSWLYRVWKNPGQEALTYLLDLPRFAAATGYLQFFALLFYLIGLFFLSPRPPKSASVK